MNALTHEFEKLNVVKLKLEILESNQQVILFYQSLNWDLRPELITMSKTLKKLSESKM